MTGFVKIAGQKIHIEIAVDKKRPLKFERSLIMGQLNLVCNYTAFIFSGV